MPTVNLVPLGLGELLDQTFSTFRKHFWLFAGIMVLPEAIIVGLNIVLQVYLSGFAPPHAGQSPQAAAQSAAAAMRLSMVSIAAMIPHYIVYAMALGATTYALSEVYLGRTTTIRESYRVVLNKLWRILKVIFSILLRTFGIFILAGVLFGIMIAAVAPILKSMPWVAAIVGFCAILGLIIVGILAIIFLVRYSVAVPALVLERLSARQALKRSVALTKGYLWRLLLVAVLMTLISITVVSLCQMPFTVASIVLMAKGGHPSLWLTIPSLLVGGVGGAATAPLLMICFAIAYYDLRVRKEGFDLQLMMANLEGDTPRGAAGQNQLPEGLRLEDSSVFWAVVWAFLTGGISQPIWFLQRRKALNHLHSTEKLGIVGPSVALAAFIANFCFPIVGSIKWGSWVSAENALGPLHPLILLVAGFIIMVQSFKVRGILLDHLAPREEGMFSASIRFQYEELFSRMGTFFFGIFYLQSKINGLLSQLTPDPGGEAGIGPLVPPAAPLPPMNS
jgi:hypothetical protein